MRLTDREKDVVRLIGAGHSDARISRELGIEHGTVRSHIASISDKLGGNSRPRSKIMRYYFYDRLIKSD